MKDEFLANMSHELRTPLSAILGMAEGLEDGVFGELNSSQKISVNTIQQSGHHLLELINEVLDLAKIEAGGVDLDLADVSPMQLCESSLQCVAQAAKAKSLELRLNACWDLPQLEADEKRLRQVLINLLDNAIKFTPEGGSIALGVEETASCGNDVVPVCRFSVKDSGIGIAASQIQEVFKPFVQADAALNREFGGVGLGLSLVKRFVHLHGGTVRVSSEIGAGSCFTVDIPFRRSSRSATGDLKAALHTGDSAGVLSSSTGRKVLLVEDNEPVGLSLSAYLTSCNYAVELVRNGREALARAEESLPSVVLMDIQMPGMDGYEVITRMRQHHELKNLPIIAITGHAMPGDKERCLAAGADDYISKPARGKDVAGMIAGILDGRANR